MAHVAVRIKVEDPLTWWERFRGVGATLRESHGISGGEVFRGEDPNVMLYVDDIYAYLKARADGVIGRGRPDRLPKPKDDG